MPPGGNKSLWCPLCCVCSRALAPLGGHCPHAAENGLSKILCFGMLPAVDHMWAHNPPKLPKTASKPSELAPPKPVEEGYCE